MFVAGWRGSSFGATATARRSRRSATSRSSPSESSTPRRRERLAGAPRKLRPRSSAARASSATRGSSPRPRPRSSRRSARSSSASAPSSRSWERIDPERYLAALEPVGWKLGLERMQALLRALGKPAGALRSIHVVGTNGKSSVDRDDAPRCSRRTGIASRRLRLAAHHLAGASAVIVGAEIGAGAFAAAPSSGAARRSPRSSRPSPTATASPSSKRRPPPPSSPSPTPGSRSR